MSSERSCSISSENTDKLNLDEDQEWKDTETDEEKVKVVNLFGPETFDSVQSMLKHCIDLGVCVFFPQFISNYES